MSVPERPKSVPGHPDAVGQSPACDVMTDKRLTTGARAVYAYLATLADGRTGRLGAVSVRDIANDMGLARGWSVQRHMVALRELGHVLVETRGDGYRDGVLWLGWGCPRVRADSADLDLVDSRLECAVTARQGCACRGAEFAPAVWLRADCVHSDLQKG